MIGRLHVWNDYVISRGGATVLKVGEQNVIRERSEQKIFFVPPHLEKWGVQFFYTWGVRARKWVSLLNTLKFAVWLSH